MREPPRVSRFELSESNKKIRWILVVVLLAIGFVAIGAGLMGLLNRDTGWQEIEVATTEPNCSPDFVLQYDLSGSGAEATVLYKQISAIYTEGCVKAYQLFHVDEGSESYENVYDINHNPNQSLVVDPLLYKAFEALQDTRYLYLGPAYAHYNSVIFNTPEAYLEQLDPATSQDAKDFVAQIAAYAASPEDVTLELLGDNRVKLVVSDRYLAFAAENEIENFIDFRYMANGFIIDYLADLLLEKGFEKGVLSSCDGYTRNLYVNAPFSYNVFDKQGNTVYPAGVMNYRGPVSMVNLKNYPMAPSDAYYRENGDHMVHTYVDLTDGMYRTAITQFIGYRYDASCVDVLLEMLPGLVGEDFVVPAGVYGVWCEDGVIRYNDGKLTISNLLQENGISYRAEFAQ